MNGQYEICIGCATRFGAVKKGAMGMHMGECDICLDMTGLANARHDFGMTDEHVEKVRMFIEESRDMAEEEFDSQPCI
jgi:hypothetical protein